ncbi:MAG TPA: fused MFS/spermidine synthase [Steroidobacteraceae bacterium]|nr:fused MFS/spermidine synthase [Steroidobacteraceae bacterium]
MKDRLLITGPRVAVCYLIAFWSGFFVMGVELLGGRILAPNFGSSIYVWGAIITVFMLALSLGYLAGGRWSQHNPSLARLGLLLGAAAVTALPVLALSGAVMEELAFAVPDVRFGSMAGAAALFFIPTFFSGMVSPYCVRLLVDQSETSGRRAGQLYFVSTFGSAGGTIMTSFYLVKWFEVNTILIGLISISAVLSVLAALSRSERK